MLPQFGRTGDRPRGGYAPESLRVNPDKLAGLRSVSFVEAFEGIQSPRPHAAERTAARAGLRLCRAAGRI